MSDFLLDFREPELRKQSATQAASLLKFCDDTQVQVIQSEYFSLVLTRVDDLEVWAPYEHNSPAERILVALVGRIALDQPQWDAASTVEGRGGLACKAIFQLYRQGGIDALEALNGNFVVLVCDSNSKSFYVVTDRCGMYLAYAKENWEQTPLLASHPDVLASVLGESKNWDTVSLAEFLMTTRLTFPYTYYQNIRGIEPGHIFTIALQNGSAKCQSKRRYFNFSFKIDPNVSEWDLAEELATGFKNAVQRRTLPFLGRVGVALSGGLDSRAILAATGSKDNVLAFSLFDEENRELRAARSIAEACGVEMVPIQREFDYYGISAELGVRISGGTGPLTCNHLLGARSRLKELGILGILTGCYCDYLFKGLALNTFASKFSRIEKLGKFQFECYERCSWFESPYLEGVLDRLKTRFPEAAKDRLSLQDWLNVERKRTFPLAYEVDLPQRVIPQHVMGWYLPLIDNDIIETYLKIPSHYKLNNSLFKKMLTVLCPPKLCRIPDSNTGACLTASWPSQALHKYYSSIRGRIDAKFRDRMVTQGSWPNMRHYFCHSNVIQSLWARSNPVAQDTYTSILGKNPFTKPMREHAEENAGFSFNLLTQKLWLDQRCELS